MGTRADFYVGRGESAEWLGSIAYDGYPDGIDDAVLKARTESAYRARVVRFLAEEESATLPKDGWPWPWETSHTTDYAYAFDKGRVWACCFGHRWYHATDPALNDDETSAKEAVFPVMRTANHAPAGTKRSGVMVIRVPR
jgi:hypothetical protein